MKIISRSLILIIIILIDCFGNCCDQFVKSSLSEVESYQKTHRVFPVNETLKKLTIDYLPRFWRKRGEQVPIDFNEYLKDVDLFTNDKLVIRNPSIELLSSMNPKDQCQSYLQNNKDLNKLNFIEDSTNSIEPPIYIQVYQDQKPGDSNESWTYIKYNLVFNWSGLPEDRSWGANFLLGLFFHSVDVRKWHRLDVHVSAILAFDKTKQLKFITLMQHNYQKTYLPGRDFPKDSKNLDIVIAEHSNELYLDDHSELPSFHLVVSFLNDWKFLFDNSKKPFLWSRDKTFGSKSGGEILRLKPFFIHPNHPLESFSGSLAPPNRFFGIYTGRDGPPGYNYYAWKEYVSLAKVAALGYWREGDLELYKEIEPYLNSTDVNRWLNIIQIMEKRLNHALNQK